MDGRTDTLQVLDCKPGRDDASCSTQANDSYITSLLIEHSEHAKT